MEDREIVCIDCGEDFPFTAREQAFYAQKGFTDPKRCPKCRAKKKEARGERPRYTRERRDDRNY